MSGSWLEDALSLMTELAAEHPVLVGVFLLIILLSTAVHVVIFAAHLLLAVSRYFRRQAAELHDLSFLYRNEWVYWRREFDLDRARRMPQEQIDDELRRHNIDAQRTTAIVTAVASAVLRELQNAEHEHELRSDAADPARPSGQ